MEDRVERFESTYKELKLVKIHWYRATSKRFESTYKELKLNGSTEHWQLI